MHLYALDEENQLVSVFQAIKGKDYFCRECKGIVRVRGGRIRLLHFFHLHTDSNCRQNAKDGTHLSIQLLLRRILPKGEVLLEESFPAIGRVADLFWVSKKVVFEIQCSPISLEEIVARTADYSLLHNDVVWIFHNKWVKKKTLLAIQKTLGRTAHYLTNVDERGEGIIYDQFPFNESHFQSRKPLRLLVDLTSPRFTKEEGPWFPFSKETPTIILERMNHWSLFFKGDLLDSFLKKEPSLLFFLDEMKNREENRSRKIRTFLFFPFLFLFRSYRLIFHKILKKFLS